jgi:hypothetical protein
MKTNPSSSASSTATTSTLAQALATLRDDLDLQQPPASVLAAAQKAQKAAYADRAAPAAFAASGASGASAAYPTHATHAMHAAPAAHIPRGGHGSGHTAGRAGEQAARWRRTPPARWAWPALWADAGLWAGAATCVVVLGVSLLLALRPPEWPRETMATAASPATQPPAVAGGDEDWMPAMHFVPLVSPERLRALTAGGGGRPGGGANGGTGGTAERGGDSDQQAAAWVLTTELPQQRLAAMGLPYDPGRAAEPLRAELLVAGSGEVLAVRLLF